MRSSSISPDRTPAPRHRLAGSLPWRLAASLLFVCQLITSGPAHALDPERSPDQYLRILWGARNGFPGGQVNGISQTPDGYLWVGTDRGLFRFDGESFLEGNRVDPSLPAGLHVLGLQTDDEGSLWISQEAAQLLRYRSGHVDSFFAGSQERIIAMNRGSHGEMVVAALLEGKLRYEQGQFHRLLAANPSTSLAISIAETPDGRVWVGTRDEGVYWVGEHGLVPAPGTVPDRKINVIIPAGRGRLWVGTDNGLALWDGSAITTAGIPPALQKVQVLALLRDRDANLWIGTQRGVLRLSRDNTVSGDPVSSRTVTALFEDREGNLWIGSPQGVERLRDSAFITHAFDSTPLADKSGGPVYVDPEGRAWIAPSSGGLYSVLNGRVSRIAASGLDRDVVYSIDGAGNDLWLGRQHNGLTRLRVQNGAVVSDETYTTANGLPQNSIYAVHRSADGTVWAATLNSGVAMLRNGRVTTFTTANGLPSNSVAAIENTSDATWFATPNGLTRLAQSLSAAAWKTLTSRDGLPSDEIVSLLADSDGSLWIGTANGLAVLRSGRIEPLANLHPILREPILGVAEGIAPDRQGTLWIGTPTHLISLDRKRLLATPAELRLREYGPADGLPGTETIRRNRSIVADSRGRIWFSLNQGLATVDPVRAFASAAPSLTHIESLTADGNPVRLDTPASFAAATHRLTFNYAGLSLAVPDRVRFRYRLDGFDRDWNDPVSIRQTVYTNLAPGNYRFRVLSSNTEGEWGGQEATYNFSVAPAAWQTWWFQLSMAAGLGLLATFIFHLRMRRMTEKLNLRFEERLAERTRIAQELHDTLLQGFLSASMQLHVAAEQLPPGSPIRDSIDHVLTRMQQVNQEGRNTLRGLRSESGAGLTLEQSFSRVPQERPAVASSDGNPSFRVIVQGQPRALHPVIRDEAWRIGREAIFNAFLHARAASIEVEIEYTPNHLHIVVRDDGVGIDPQILRTGREGHWGLVGMRERAGRIGASLKLFSRTEAGTEVELDIPSHIAYQHPPITFLRRLANFLPARLRRSS